MLHIIVALLFSLFWLPTHQQCVEQSDGCLKCVTQTICMICDFGWELQTTNNTCTKCVTGCMTCSSGVCSKCFSGFTLTNGLCGCPLGKGADSSSNTCINCLISNCQNCSFKANECTSCTNGLGFIPSSPWCRTCQDANCYECKNDYSICVICNDGYGLSSGTCTACSYGCKVCSRDVYVCQDCLEGFGLNYDYCEQCSYQHGSACLKCQSSNIMNCTQCISTATRVVYEYEAYCNTCYASYCLECVPGLYYMCQTCNSGYVLMDNGQCSNCTGVANCYSCIFVTTCTICISTTKLVGGICQACPEGCYCSNSTTCSSCIAKYGKNQAGLCSRCLDLNCSSCYANYTICSYCLTNYTINAGTCVLCGQAKANCIECSTGSAYCYKCLYKQNHGPYSGSCDVMCMANNCSKCQYSAAYCSQCPQGYIRLYPDCVPCSDIISQCKTCTGQDSYMAMCTTCNDGYALKSNLCHPCDNPQCSLCPLESHTCTLCMAPFNLYSGDCITCVDNKCISCVPNDPSNCTYCVDGYGAQAGSCVVCSSSDCLQCPQSPTVCTLCVLGLGPLNGSCVTCTVANCLQCSQLSSKCQKCNVGYLLSGQLSCQTCSDTKCNYCPVSFSNCLSCKSPYGLSSSNACVNCQVACATCKTTNYQQCLTCKPGYSLSGVTCVACTQTKCNSCPNSTTVCVSCVEPYGISGGACVACHTNCLTCKGQNYQACITCRPYNYLDASQTCTSCSPSCSNCTNLTHCLACDSLFYLDETYQCSACQSVCTACQLDPISVGPSCTGCIAGYILIDQGSYFQCKLPCIVGSANYPCSLEFGNLWDGCNDACEVEQNFNCSSPQICSYFGNVSLNFTSIRKEPLSNYITIQTEVYPPLFVFTQSNLLSIFTITNPSLKLTSIAFNQQANTLTFVAEILNDVNNITQITILFNPSTSTDLRYEATPDDQYAFNIVFTQHLPYYYSPIALLAIMLLFYLSWVSVVLSCMAVLSGWALRRLAGLEALIVLQFGFVNVLWLDSYLHPFYEQIWPLKFSTGYAFPFIQQQQAIGSGFNYAAPYTSQFSLSSQFLLNNFNVMLGLQICAAVITVISKVILKILIAKMPHNQQVINPKRPKSVKRTEWVYQFCLQTWFYLTMINLVNFISCSTLWFKYGDTAHMGSIICFAATVLVTLAVSIYLLYDPDPFGYFRYSFRYTVSSCFNELAFKQYSIYQAVIIMSTCFLILTSVPFVAIILLFILALHVLIYAPYKERKQNWRACLNLLAMCGVASIRTYLQYTGLPNHNDLILNILLILVYGALFTIVSFLALAFTIYHYVYWKYIKPKEDENNEEEILRKQKYLVYDMLDDFNLNKKVRDNPKNSNVFRKIGKSRQTLLQFSNELFQQRIQTNRVNLESLGSKSTQIEGEGDSSSRIQFKKQFHVKKLKDESRAGQETKVDEPKISEPVQIEMLNIKNSSKVLSSGQCIEESALQVLADQNMYISLKSSETKMKEIMKDPQDKNAISFQNAYDDIPSDRGFQSIIKEEPIQQQQEDLSENEMTHKNLKRHA